MLGMGLQYRTVDDVASEIDLPASQILGLFNRLMRRLLSYLHGVMERTVEATLPPAPDDAQAGSSMQPLAQSLDTELEEAAQVCGDACIV
jgi:N-acetyltransferase 10